MHAAVRRWGCFGGEALPDFIRRTTARPPAGCGQSFEPGLSQGGKTQRASVPFDQMKMPQPLDQMKMPQPLNVSGRQAVARASSSDVGHLIHDTAFGFGQSARRPIFMVAVMDLITDRIDQPAGSWAR